MKPCVWLLAAGLVAGGGSAWAQEGESGATARALAGRLDAAPAAVLQLRPAALDDARRFYLQVGPPEARRTVQLTSLAAGAVLGFDPLSARGWRAAGFDTDAPILASLGLDDAGARRVHAALAGGAAAASVSPAFWRGRLVWRARDVRVARASLARLAALAPGFAVLGDAPPAAIAALVGAPPARARAAVAALRRRGVIAAGRHEASGWLVLVRLDADVLIVDALGSFAGLPLDWDRHGAALLAELDRKGAPGSAPWIGPSQPGADGPAAASVGPAAAVWLAPETLLSMSIAARRSLDAGMLATARPRGGDPVDSVDLDAPCADFRAIAAAGPLADLTFALDVGDRELSARARWRLRNPGELAHALVVADDGLLSGDHLATAPAAAVFSVGSLDALRALARPPAFTAGIRPLRRAIFACGAGAAPVTWGVGWVQVASMMLDDIATIDPVAETLVRSVRNGAFVLLPPGDAPEPRLVLVGSLAARATPLVERIFDVVFGARRQAGAEGRALVAWGGGPLQPFFWPRGDLAVVGATFNAPGAGVPLRQLTPAPHRGELARFAADPAAALTALGAADLLSFWPGRPPTRLEGTATLDDHALTLSTRLHFR